MNALKRRQRERGWMERLWLSAFCGAYLTNMCAHTKKMLGVYGNSRRKSKARRIRRLQLSNWIGSTEGSRESFVVSARFPIYTGGERRKREEKTDNNASLFSSSFCRLHFSFSLTLSLRFPLFFSLSRTLTLSLYFFQELTLTKTKMFALFAVCAGIVVTVLTENERGLPLSPIWYTPKIPLYNPSHDAINTISFITFFIIIMFSSSSKLLFLNERSRKMENECRK